MAIETGLLENWFDRFFVLRKISVGGGWFAGEGVCNLRCRWLILRIGGASASRSPMSEE
jgi:hypothetical protein